MSMAGGFLGGAKDRLLPAAIPFRFFVSAALFHLLAWGALFLAADEVASFRGGAGPALAAIHLLTLGVFAMTAIGASLQLFPVVTRRALTRHWPGHLVFALILPGTALLSLGMATYGFDAMRLGAILVGAGFAVFVAITASNLRGASAIPAVAAHGWLALACIVFLVTLGVLLVWNLEAGFLTDHGTYAVLHLVLAVFGFMGSLVLGLSLVLIPMFILSRSLPGGPGWAQLGLAVVALVAFSAAALRGSPWLLGLAIVAGFGAAGAHLWQMLKTMKQRMRKRLGVSFLLIRVSWANLLLALFLIAAWHMGIEFPNAPALIVFTLLAGWLLTFLCGVLQRIMPFLASMHAAGKSGLPPLMSELAGESPLKLHAVCHLSALIVCATGIVLDHALLMRAGAATGLIGAAGFAVFTLKIARKASAARPAR